MAGRGLKQMSMEQKLYCTYNQVLETPKCKGCIFEGLNCKFLNNEVESHKAIKKWKHDSLMNIMMARSRNRKHSQQTKEPIVVETKSIAPYVTPQQETPKDDFGNVDFQWSNLWGREKKKAEYCKPDWSMMAWVFFASFVSSLILAFILQFCVLMTGWLFDIIGWLFGAENHAWAQTTEDMFFFASYEQAYIYGIVLMHMIAVWAFGGIGNKWANVLRGIVTTYFVVASIAMPHLFISTAIGPFFIWWCVRVVATK